MTTKRNPKDPDRDAASWGADGIAALEMTEFVRAALLETAEKNEGNRSAMIEAAAELKEKVGATVFSSMSPEGIAAYEKLNKDDAKRSPTTRYMRWPMLPAWWSVFVAPDAWSLNGPEIDVLFSLTTRTLNEKYALPGRQWFWDTIDRAAYPKLFEFSLGPTPWIWEQREGHGYTNAKPRDGLAVGSSIRGVLEIDDIARMYGTTAGGGSVNAIIDAVATRSNILLVGTNGAGLNVAVVGDVLASQMARAIATLLPTASRFNPRVEQIDPKMSGRDAVDRVFNAMYGVLHLSNLDDIKLDVVKRVAREIDLLGHPGKRPLVVASVFRPENAKLSATTARRKLLHMNAIVEIPLARPTGSGSGLTSKLIREQIMNRESPRENPGESNLDNDSLNTAAGRYFARVFLEIRQPPGRQVVGIARISWLEDLRPDLEVVSDLNEDGDHDGALKLIGEITMPRGLFIDEQSPLGEAPVLQNAMTKWNQRCRVLVRAGQVLHVQGYDRRDRATDRDFVDHETLRYMANRDARGGWQLEHALAIEGHRRVADGIIEQSLRQRMNGGHKLYFYFDLPADEHRATEGGDFAFGFWMECIRLMTPRANPTKPANGNTWEVRSATGLEGTYPDAGTANKAAAKLRASGVPSAKASPRAQLEVPRPAGAPPQYHVPKGRPPGVPNPPEINEGMARAIWVTTFADRVENMTPAERKRSGIDEYMRACIDWSEVVPRTPSWAYEAAEDLYAKFEAINDESMNALYATAEAAHRAEARRVGGNQERYLDDFDAPEMHELFGHCLAMQAMGHGVSWFDDHATFKLKFPRFDPGSYDDGKLHLPASPAPVGRRSR